MAECPARGDGVRHACDRLRYPGHGRDRPRAIGRASPRGTEPGRDRRGGAGDTGGPARTRGDHGLCGGVRLGATHGRSARPAAGRPPGPAPRCLREPHFVSRTAADFTFEREPLPPLDALAHDWRSLEALARPSLFTCWAWIGTYLDCLPEESRPDLLRASSGARTTALALLGARRMSRRHGLVRPRTLYVNETGRAEVDLTTEHNAVLVAEGDEQAALDALTLWFARNGRV